VAVASDIQIDRFRKDTPRWRLKVQQLLRYYADTLPERNVLFLDSLALNKHQDELSYLQAEWVLDIDDSVTMVSTYRQYSLARLIRVCYENRLDFDGDDGEWIATLYNSGLTSVRRYEARRVYNLAKQIGEVDDWAA
jgi:hypothetical protein